MTDQRSFYDEETRAVSDCVVACEAVEDTRLKLRHWRLLAFFGRGQKEVWWSVSQGWLARRFVASRQAINLALSELVEWGYLEKIDQVVNQAETGSSRCLYRRRMPRGASR